MAIRIKNNTGKKNNEQKQKSKEEDGAFLKSEKDINNTGEDTKNKRGDADAASG